MAVTIQEPEFPASQQYPTSSPHDKRVERAHSRFLSHLSDQENWNFQGERNEVKLWKKPDVDEQGQFQVELENRLHHNSIANHFQLQEDYRSLKGNA